MGEVIVRQWGPDCYAAYVVGSGLYPYFVGTGPTRVAAREMAETRLGATIPGGVCDGPGDPEMGEWSEESDGPRVLDNPGPSAPEPPGATP